jgi:hypothetical protein
MEMLVTLSFSAFNNAEIDNTKTLILSSVYFAWIRNLTFQYQKRNNINLDVFEIYIITVVGE